MILFDEYQTWARTTRVYPDSPFILETFTYGRHHKLHLPIYPFLKIGGEAGEVPEKVAKIIRDHDGIVGPEERDALIKELGDQLWYISDIASCLKVSLSEVAERNVTKLTERMRNNTVHGSGDNR